MGPGVKRGERQQGTSLRMAVIGCGPIGLLHAEAIARSPYAELGAVCDRDHDRAEAASRRFGVKAYLDARELLEKEPLDGVSAATPDHLHAEVALPALAASRHVFCEKPLAGSLEEARRMVEAAAGRGVHLAVNYNRRFAFGYRKARELIAAGKIGAVDSAVVTVTDQTPWPEVARTPHVILTNLLTHHIDLLRVFAGEVRSVHALFGKTAPGELVREVVLSFEFAGGAVGAIIAGYRDRQSRTSERMEIAGSLGAIAIEDATRRVTLFEKDPDSLASFSPNHFVEGDTFYDTLKAHVEAFIEQVAAGREPPVTGRDGLRAMEIAAAAVESHRQGRSIEV